MWRRLLLRVAPLQGFCRLLSLNPEAPSHGNSGAARRIFPIQLKTMNADQTVIQSAYEEALHTLYAKLFEAYITTGGAAAQEQEADGRFIAGLTVARRSRDRALALLA
jgi:hypothetical protein